MKRHTLISPLRVPQTKKKDFILNLNVYRNAHFMVLNNAKRAYEKAMKEQVVKLPVMKNIGIQYILYPARKSDVANVCCVIDKFFADTLTKHGKIEDDDCYHYPAINYRFGHIDKENPRCEIIIEELNNADSN